MSSSKFSELPVELLFMVMKNLQNPRDLSRLLQASKLAWLAYQQSPSPTLRAIIRNAIPSENLRIAIAACKASENAKLRWGGALATQAQESHDRFWKENPQGCALDDSALQDRDVLISLSKLWCISEYFLSCFQDEVLKVATQKLGSLRVQCDQNLSYCEKVKMQRAFFRFEIYRKITQSTRTQIANPYDTSDMQNAEGFLQRFPPWEREEILSVVEFLVEYVKKMTRRLEDDIVRAFSEMSLELASKLGDTETTSLERSEIKWIVQKFLLSDIVTFIHTSSLMAFKAPIFVIRGLPFIRWLSKLPTGDCLAADICYSQTVAWPSFGEACELCDYQLQQHDAQTKWTDEHNEGQLKTPNAGWVWARNHQLIGLDGCLQRRHILRDMGYIFWDASRIDREWKEPFVSPARFAQTARQEYNYYEPDLVFPARESLEQRLLQIRIPTRSHLEDMASGPQSCLKASEAMSQKLANGHPAPFSAKEAEDFDIEY